MFQAKALANAVFAYASNIDDLGKLTNAIGIIAQKHVSFQVPPNSYQDVGTELLRSIKEILGDAATDEIMVKLITCFQDFWTYESTNFFHEIFFALFSYKAEDRKNADITVYHTEKETL